MVGIAQGLDHFQRELPPIHGGQRERLVAVVGQLLQATPHDVADPRRNVDLQISALLRILQQSFRDQQPDRLAHEEGVAFRLVPDPLDEDFRRTDPGRQFDVAADVLLDNPSKRSDGPGPPDRLRRVFGRGDDRGRAATSRYVPTIKRCASRISWAKTAASGAMVHPPIAGHRGSAAPDARGRIPQERRDAVK